MKNLAEVSHQARNKILSINLVSIICLLFSISMFSQVGINTTTPAAQLEITSSNQAAPANTDGIIIPKIDAFPATNPTAAQQSMMVYLTTASGVNNPGFYYWDNATSTWIGILGKLGWEVSGNVGTIAGTNYIGTADNVDVSVKANALERIRISSSTGNIGFNTPTPLAQLHVTASNQTNPSFYDGIIIPKVDIFPTTNPSAAQQSMLLYLTTASGTNLPGFYYWDNVTTSWISVSGKVGWSLTGNTGTVAGTNYIGTTDANDLVFDTNALERMRIKQTTGNIGIGTVTPSENLQVVNNIKIGTTAWGSALNDKFLKFGDGNFVTIGEEFLDDSMSFKANRFFFNNGNVGIGVTTPFLNRLQIGNPPGFSGNDIAIGNGTQAMSIFQSPTASTFFTNTNFAFMPASGTGNVGVGTTTPLANLHVSNPQNTDTDVTVLIARNSASAGSTWSMGSIEFYTEGLDNIGFSTKVSPLGFNGAASLGSATGTKYDGFRWSTLFCTSNPNVSSDITLKKEIKPLQYGLDAVRKINPISYVFKTEKLPNGKELDDVDKTKMLGFSAQELLQVLPEVVSTSSWVTKDEKTYTKQKTETLGVRYGDIIPVAINAIKELDATFVQNNKELKEKIKNLEAQNIALENRLKLLEKKL